MCEEVFGGVGMIIVSLMVGILVVGSVFGVIVVWYGEVRISLEVENDDRIVIMIYIGFSFVGDMILE